MVAIIAASGTYGREILAWAEELGVDASARTIYSILAKEEAKVRRNKFFKSIRTSSLDRDLPHAVQNGDVRYLGNDSHYMGKPTSRSARGMPETGQEQTC